MASRDKEAPPFERVYIASGQLRAHLIKSRLESEGIPVFLRYDSGSTVFALTVDGLGEVEILVPTVHASRAREILAQAK